MPDNQSQSEFIVTARAAIETGDAAGGLAVILEALRNRIDDAGAWYEAAVFLHGMGDYGNALVCLDRVQTLDPGRLGGPLFRGACLRALGRFPEAAACLAELVERAPDLGEAWHLLGLSLAGGGRFDLALQTLAQAKALGIAEADDRIWRVLFQSNRWEEAWTSFEASLPAADLEARWREQYGTGHRLWRGETLAGRELVLFSHGGHGDTLQFFRFVAPILAEKPTRLVLIVEPSLRRLIQSSPLLTKTGDTVVQIVGTGETPKLAEDGYFSWFEGLAGRFRASPDMPPPAPPYFAGPTGSPAILDGGQGRKIGLAWRGSPAMPEDSWRSIPLGIFEPLFALPGYRWFALQKEPLDNDEAQILARHGVADFSGELEDFADTAAFMSELDLVISVDSAAAHLAGALGRPVWLLNRANSEWRWGWQPSGSFWYPSMRIFNQAEIGDWRPVIDELSQALAGLQGETPAG